MGLRRWGLGLGVVAAVSSIGVIAWFVIMYLSKINSTLDRAVGELGMTNRKLGSVEEELTTLRADLNNGLARTNDTISRVDKGIGGSTASLDDVKEKLQTLKRPMDALSVTPTILNRTELDISAMSGTLAGTKTDIGLLLGQISRVAKATSFIPNLESDIHGTKPLLELLNSSVKAMDASVSGPLGQVPTKLDHLADRLGVLESLPDEIRPLTGLKDDLGELAKRLDKSNDSLQGLKEQLGSAGNDLRAIRVHADSGDRSMTSGGRAAGAALVLWGILRLSR